MPEQQNVDYHQALEELVNVHNVDSLFDNYLRYKAGLLKTDENGNTLTDSHFVKSLGERLNPEDPDMFLNETQAAVEDQVHNYQRQKEPVVAEIVKAHGGRLLNEYALILSNVVGHVAQEATSDLEKKVNKDMSKEERENTIRAGVLASVYVAIGKMMSSLTPSEEYKNSENADKELLTALKGVKEIESMTPDQIEEFGARFIIEKNGLTPNYRNFRRNWRSIGQEVHQNQLVQYLKLIGSKFVKDGSINEDLLKQVYKNPETMKQVAGVIKKLYSEQHRAAEYRAAA